MSMTAITAFQLLGIVCAYFIICILLPHWVIGKTVRFRNRYERFLLYTVTGNFYVINLVYILELLHISHPVTLILFTVVPCAVIKIRIERIPYKEKFLLFWENTRRIVGGQMKFKALRDANRPQREARIKKIGQRIKKVYIDNIFDVLLVIGVILCSFWTYGVNLFENYGYKLTDVVVHNFWINQLSENDIFTKGVYPYGYHNVIYYIHEVFRIDTYVVLRLYSVVVVTWIVILLLCFLKLLCKSKYLPYLACFGYTVVNCFEEHTYSRFAALIPQEYGMIFVLPTLYCGFEYFREQQRENRGSNAKRSYIYLAGFLMSFSMSLSVHFYGFIIVGIGCAAMAIGFISLFVRKPYFKKVIVTCVISLIVAVAPMAISYAFGKELEYSLKWGLSVITGTTVTRPEEVTEGSQGSSSGEEQPENESMLSLTKAQYIEKYGTVVGSVVATAMTVVTYVDYASLAYSNVPLILSVVLSFLLLIVMGIAIALSRRKDNIYGMTLATMGIFMVFMTLLVASGGLGIVQLMDLNRASIFFTYLVGAAVIMFVDAVFYLTVFLSDNRKICNAVSLAVVMILVGIIAQNNLVRERITTTGFESNDAITCLKKIISDTKDDTWTICSANDEGRMVYGHGYHFELIEFLRAMEYVGSNGWIRIPTQTVYFFVEKKPIDYYVKWTGSGTYISEEYASEHLPLGNNRAIYEGENRWICMSRFYYWAEAFQELYPNEVTVFYETDSFICYRIEQNPYRLFNFSIDYGYNVFD